MADYKHDYSCVPVLAKGAAMHQVMIDKAFEAIPFARSISPDAPPYGEGYIASFEVDGSHLERVAGVQRATAYLRNTSEHAVFVERGTGGGDFGHHVLARTVSWIERS